MGGTKTSDETKMPETKPKIKTKIPLDCARGKLFVLVSRPMIQSGYNIISETSSYLIRAFV